MRFWLFTVLAAVSACAPQNAGNQAAEIDTLDNALATVNAADVAATDALNGVDGVDSPDMNSAASDLNVAGAGSSGDGWQYDTRRDEMRGTTTRNASLTSANQVSLSFPYGTVRARLVVRQRPQDGLNVMFIADEGQVLCNSFSDSRLSVKFDDGPVRTFGCDGASSGSPEIAFFSAPREVLAQIKRARRMIVEAEFYNDGPQQFTFELAGLNWE